MKRGRDEAADILYLRYSEALIRYGFGRGLTFEEAEDAVIDTFTVRLVRKLPEYDRSRASVRSWLFHVLFRGAVESILDSRPPTVPFAETDDLFEIGRNIEETAEEIGLWATYDAIMLSISDWDWLEIYLGPGKSKLGRKEWRDVVYRYKEALCERYCGADTSSATRCFFKLTLVTR